MELTIVEKNKDNNNYNLTRDQEIASGEMIEFIGRDFNPSKYIVGLVGAGGVGKTYTINFIIKNCRYSRSVIRCAAPAHKACRVLSEAIEGHPVDTIHSVFGFRPNLRLENFDPKNPQFASMGKTKLDGIKLLIIDESSMIPFKVVNYICDKCKELGIKVIFMGDDYQLSPPRERKSTAFSRCYVIYTLTQIVRQGINNPINPLLKMLRDDIDKRRYSFLDYISKRVGKSFYNDIGEGYKVLTPTGFTEQVNHSFSDKAYTSNIDMYRIIAYTNNCVTGWNKYIRDTIIKDADRNILTKNDLVMSYETIVDEFLDVIINNSEEYIVNDITNFVDDKYGFKGFLVRFQLVHGGMVTRPLFVIDHTDKFTINMYHKIKTTLTANGQNSHASNRVGKWNEYYDFKKKYLLAANIWDHRTGKIIHDRDIDYGFSLTAHKSQGSTYGSVFVNVNNIIYDKNGQPYADQDDLLRRLYVACSRTKKELILHYG